MDENQLFLPLCLKLDIHQITPSLLGKGKEEKRKLDKQAQKLNVEVKEKFKLTQQEQFFSGLMFED